MLANWQNVWMARVYFWILGLSERWREWLRVLWDPQIKDVQKHCWDCGENIVVSLLIQENPQIKDNDSMCRHTWDYFWISMRVNSNKSSGLVKNTNTRGVSSFLETEMNLIQYPSMDNEIHIPSRTIPIKGKGSRPDNLPFSISNPGWGQT